MAEMIDRIARKLDPALWASYDGQHAGARLQLTEDAIDQSRKRAEAIAREIEKPSAAMIRAGDDAHDPEWQYTRSAEIWSAMCAAMARD